MKLVSLMAVKPVVGSYACSIAVADAIVDAYVDDENGNIVKRKQGRRRFSGCIDVERRATAAEIQAAIEGRLPRNIEVLGEVPKKAMSLDGATAPMAIKVHAEPFEVPEDIAADLVERGLARRTAA